MGQVLRTRHRPATAGLVLPLAGLRPGVYGLRAGQRQHLAVE